MKKYVSQFPTVLALLLGCCLLFSGCLKTRIVTDKPSSRQTVELKWAHGFILGLVPPVNAPLEVGGECDNGISEIYFRQTFVQGLAQGLAQSIYTPQRFTVTCASGGSMSSADTPPSYLLRDSNTKVSSARTDASTEKSSTKKK